MSMHRLVFLAIKPFIPSKSAFLMKWFLQPKFLSAWSADNHGHMPEMKLLPKAVIEKYDHMALVTSA